MHESGTIGICVEQRLQDDFVPQRRFADARLEDRALVGRVGIGVLQRDRQRAKVFQRGFDAGLLRGLYGEREFEEGHLSVRWRTWMARRSRLFGGSSPA
jgi:hypothetical protein